MIKFISEHPYVSIYIIFVAVNLLVGIIADKGRIWIKLMEGPKSLVPSITDSYIAVPIAIFCSIIICNISYLITCGHLGLLHAFKLDKKKQLN